ncbi:uncharacterized protein Z520_05935 [Fonsecaea multimorphosa CBS 102226]|uniref:Uncharacterized protein n=1 Tax=Fonsecaea multimorphosa CBS 102226 TaxID=1442371 RepID=A0A0D2K623_9EURO|nr:uncharacterized protein Z520_05935 [Fonsecaea multimorphosa CBS 102226]KIX98634.1 hypothetical protein Z520_05935 [Fonsecaea multimorphosa CBS 102226]OAL24823.1 hypothetical protein AYO22_05612 [Fonsecaea multimorphosa]
MAISSASQQAAEREVERSVSVLGLGQMGFAVAQAFTKKGYKTTVWNRTAAKARPLVAAGAIVATSVGDCIASNQLVLSCFIETQVLIEVLKTVDPQLCRGRVLVDFASGTLRETRQFQTIARELSFAYIRGSIASTPPYVGSSQIHAWYCGNETIFRSIQPDLAALAQPGYIDNDPGTIALHECAGGNIFYAFAAGFVQAMAVVKASGKCHPGGAEDFVNKFMIPFLHTFPDTFRDWAHQIDNQNYDAHGKGARLGQSAKSINLMRRFNTELGLTSVILDPVLSLIKHRIAQGGSNEELSSLVETIADSKAGI